MFSFIVNFLFFRRRPAIFSTVALGYSIIVLAAPLGLIPYFVASSVTAASYATYRLIMIKRRTKVHPLLEA